MPVSVIDPFPSRGTEQPGAFALDSADGAAWAGAAGAAPGPAAQRAIMMGWGSVGAAALTPDPGSRLRWPADAAPGPHLAAPEGDPARAADNVAVNFTISTTGEDFWGIRTAVRDSVHSEDFAQRLNNSGAHLLSPRAFYRTILHESEHTFNRRPNNGETYRGFR
jgi:hypothetical protein